jgi:hypothetical protein
MKIVTNQKLISRNAKIGKYTTFASLAVLGIGMYLTFAQSELINWSFAALMVGFLLSQIGIYFSSRWGKSPRPDEILNTSLKGLEDKYTLYHYAAVIPHLLVGPAGIWIINPYQQAGTITYNENKGRWQQKGGNLYLKIFAQDSLGRPDLEAKTHTEDLQKFIKEKFPDTQFPAIQNILVFTNPKANVQAPEAPIPTLVIDKLKEFIRKRPKESALPQDCIKLLQDTFPKPAKE